MVNYTGGIELGNVPHGFGVGIFLDENPTYTYTGEWRHGLATGFGKIAYANGDSYTGKVNFFVIKIFEMLSKISHKIAIKNQGVASFLKQQKCSQKGSKT